MSVLPNTPNTPYDWRKHSQTVNNLDFSNWELIDDALDTGINMTAEAMAYRWHEATKVTAGDTLIDNKTFDEMYGHLGLDWEEDLTFGQAARRASVRERNIISSIKQGSVESTAGKIGLFATSLAPQFLSPTNIAMSAVPIFGGGKKFIEFSKQFKNWQQGAMLGAAGGMIGTGVLEPLNYAATTAEGDEYTATDFMVNTFVMGPLVGAGIGAPLGVVQGKMEARAKQNPDKIMDELTDAISNALDEGKIDAGIPIGEDGLPTAEYVKSLKKEESAFDDPIDYPDFKDEIDTVDTDQLIREFSELRFAQTDAQINADLKKRFKVKGDSILERFIAKEITPDIHVEFNKINDLDSLAKNYHNLKTNGVPDLPNSNASVKVSSGMLVRIDGKMVLVKPEGTTGTLTIPKGKVHNGESLQEGAIRQFFEDTGLVAKITGIKGSAPGTTGVNIIYTGEIVGNQTAKKNVVYSDSGIQGEDSIPVWQGNLLQEKGYLADDPKINDATSKFIDDLTKFDNVPADVSGPAVDIKTKKPLYTKPLVKSIQDTATIDLNNPEIQQVEKPILDEQLYLIDDNPSIAGSNPAYIMGDVNGPNNYYVKLLSTVKDKHAKSNADHLRSEYVANLLYRLAGVATLNQRLVVDAQGNITGLASVLQNDLVSSAPPSAKINDGALIDMWLGNWDVDAPGNVGVLGAGQPVRIDVGGSLLYRAKGGLKGKDGKQAFNKTVGELESMAKADVYGNVISEESFQTGLDKLSKFSREIIEDAVDLGGFKPHVRDKLVDTLVDRRQYIIDKMAKDHGLHTRATTKLNIFLSGNKILKLIQEQSKQLKGKLSSVEEKAMLFFQGSSYMDFNRYLRGEYSPSPAHKKKFDKVKKDLKSALYKFKTQNSMVLSRKIGSADKFFAVAMKQTDATSIDGLIGKTITDKGFASTSLDFNAWSGDVHMELHAPKGTPGLFMAAKKTDKHSHESEFLLPADLNYRIQEVEQLSNGKWRVVAEILPEGQVSKIQDFTVQKYHSEAPDPQYDADAIKEPGVDFQKLYSKTKEEIGDDIDILEELEKELADWDSISEHTSIKGGCIDG